MDVLKFIHSLGLNLIPRTTDYHEFVKIYECLGGGDWWGIKVDEGMDEIMMAKLEKSGFLVPRPTVAIAKVPPSQLSAELMAEIIGLRPVFYLTRQNKATHAFAILVSPNEVILEGIVGNELFGLRRSKIPDFSIDANGFERGNIPKELRALWARASARSVEEKAVIEGFRYEDGALRVYEVEVF